MSNPSTVRSYVPRTLSYQSAEGIRVHFEEAAIASWPTPVVLLGEPGMGKTRLLERLADSPGWVFRSARALVDHPEPRNLVSGGEGLIIDGLDELAAASEADPIYRVLGKLIAAGAPQFILSCRAADWRGAVARPDIEREYQGKAPTEVRIEPLDRTAAAAFLEHGLTPARAQEIIAYLDDKGLGDLYGNPLTLMLFAEIAGAGEALPETRADLMRQACALMWHEGSDRHAGNALARLDAHSALQAVDKRRSAPPLPSPYNHLRTPKNVNFLRDPIGADRDPADISWIIFYNYLAGSCRGPVSTLIHILWKTVPAVTLCWCPQEAHS